MKRLCVAKSPVKTPTLNCQKTRKKGNLDMATNGKPSVTESILIAAENNTVKTSYVKAKIDKTPQNSESKLRVYMTGWER